MLRRPAPLCSRRNRMGDSCGTVLLVDDDPGFRELVSLLCQRAGYASREAATSEDALASARSEPPDVVILDVNLGATSGYQLCREFRDEFGEQLPIIIVSGRADPSDRVAGLLLGADDYVTKPFDPDDLLARVRRAVERSRSHVRKAESMRLTARELEILNLLAHGFGTHAIVERLTVSPKTVSTHVQRILAKLDVHSRAEAVAVAYREGLVGEVSAHAAGPLDPEVELATGASP